MDILITLADGMQTLAEMEDLYTPKENSPSKPLAIIIGFLRELVSVELYHSVLVSSTFTGAASNATFVHLKVGTPA